MKNIRFVFVLLIAATFFQSCQKDALDDTLNREAPLLPPVQSFVLPIDNLESLDSIQGVGPRTATKNNLLFAGLNLAVWQTAINVTMAIPVASFAEAFNHEAIFVGNNTFEWRYNTFAGGKLNTCTLSGEVLNDNHDVFWTMTVSQRTGFQDFVFYTGTTYNDGERAEWTLNHQANNPEALLDITYEGQRGGDFTIKYTNIRPNHIDNGDYIEFRADSGTGLNRAYDVLRASENNFVEIQWNEPLKYGRVRNEKHFGDNDWNCWDEMGDDVDCQ